MLFYSFFKSLVGKDVVVELKNDLAIAGTLHSVDQVGFFKTHFICLSLPNGWKQLVIRSLVGSHA